VQAQAIAISAADEAFFLDDVAGSGSMCDLAAHQPVWTQRVRRR
jgi:hypothetical protein